MQKEATLNTKRDIKIALVSFVLMSLFVLNTNPFSVPIVFVLSLPLLFAVIVFCISNILISKLFKTEERTRLIISYSLSLSLLVLFLLGSLKQLGAQDFVLVLSFIGGVAFYLIRSDANTKQLD